MALSTRIFRRSVWLLAVTSSAGIASFCDPAPGWTAAWNEEFDGNSLNAADWNTIVGTDVGGCRDALCTAANVVVSGGVLTLISNNNTVGNYNYTTGAVTTAGKHNWTYAPAYRLCVSAILPGGKDAAGQGLWPAIWLMPDVHSCDPDLGEIDILEEISGEGVGYGTYHWQTTYPKQNCTFPVGAYRQCVRGDVRALQSPRMLLRGGNCRYRRPFNAARILSIHPPIPSCRIGQQSGD